MTVAAFHPIAGAEPIPGYRLEAFLGRGGFGEVWRADAPGGFQVALKLLPADGAASERELRALRLLQRVRDGHLLALFGVWSAPGWFVLAMELADRTLMHRLQQCLEHGLPGVPRDELVEHFPQAARGLDFLNEPRHVLIEGAGPTSIGHGDVKPQNLLLVGSACKVGDFGLLRRLGPSVSQPTSSVTAAYAAPEVFEGRPARQSDQYSLAASWCHLRGGRLPFEGGPTELMAGHLHRPPDLTMLPESERAAAARALSKKPDERWPSCRAFVEALRTAGGAAPLLRADELPTRPFQAVPTALPQAAETARGAGDGTAVPPRRRFWGRPLLWVPSVLLLLAVGVVGGWIGLFGPHGSAPGDPGRPPNDQAARDGAGPGDGSPPRLNPAAQGKPFTNSVRMAMVPIRPGAFPMGSASDGPEAKVRGNDEDRREVQIQTPFHLAACPVTVGQFRHFVNDTDYHGGKKYQTEPERDGEGGWGWNEAKGAIEGRNPKYTWEETGVKPYGDDHPVVNVSWNDAAAFCEWLTKKEGMPYRLPTEAEWEYACRAGTTTAFSTGDDPESLQGHANVADASAGRRWKCPWALKFDDGYPFMAPVGSFKPNPWGLYDMHGNVWQWCADRYGKYDKDDKIDPRGPTFGGSRVLRGGSWSNVPADCRSARRIHYPPADRSCAIGFRVACSAARTP
jgi:formylglycine-generating enzyme required for sulfatase activity